MNNLSIFDIFGGDSFPPVEEKKEEKKAGKAAEKKTEKKTGKKDSGKSSKKKKGKTMDRTFQGPVEVIGRYFRKSVGTAADTALSLDDIARLLYEDGIRDVCYEESGFFESGEEGVFYLTSPETMENPLIKVEDHLHLDMGEEHLEFSLDTMFPGEDQVSLQEVSSWLKQNHPRFLHVDLSYDHSCSALYPVLRPVPESLPVPFPIRVSIHGEERLVEEADLDGTGTVLEQLSRFVALHSNVEVSFGRMGDCFYPIFRPKEGDVFQVNRGFFKQIASSAVCVEEQYRLPCTVILGQFGVKLQLTQEHFKKDRVSREELLYFLQTDFPMFRSADRTVDLIYTRELNQISVAVLSGRKGAGLFPECSREQICEGLKKDYFFGMHTRPRGSSFKIYHLPLGTFLLSFQKTGDMEHMRFIPRLKKIPATLLEEILSYFREDLSVERVVQIRYNKEEEIYSITYPVMETVSRIHADYRFPEFANGETLCMEMHSHNTMPAFFSSTDDADEAGPGIYGVAGRLQDPYGSVCFRAGVDHYFCPLSIMDLFE